MIRIAYRPVSEYDVNLIYSMVDIQQRMTIFFLNYI